MPVLLRTNRARTHTFTLSSSISRRATIIGSLRFMFLLFKWFIVVKYILVNVRVFWALVEESVNCSPTFWTEDYLFVPANLIFTSHMIINLIFQTVPPLRVEFDSVSHCDGSGEFGYDSLTVHTTYTKLHPPTPSTQNPNLFQIQPTGGLK